MTTVLPPENMVEALSGSPRMNASGFDDIPQSHSADGPPIVARETILLANLKAPTPDDGRELIRNRFLCRAGSMLFVGPTGAGKSSFALQAGILWSIGKPCFGLRPSGSLRILYIQAENDEGDLYEIRNGIYEGLNLLPSEREIAGRNVLIATVNDAVGENFLANELRPLLSAHRPDILILDPLLAYLGDDVSRQDVVSRFVRSGVQTAIAEADCGLVLVHHPPKPKQDKVEAKAGDDAYFGAGSADLANWVRSVLVLKPTSQHGVYKLRLAKRGARAGWVEADERTPSFERTIAHGKGGLIYWRDVDPGEVFTPVATDTAKADVLALVPPESPIDKDILISKAGGKGIGSNRARGFISELVSEGRLFEWKIPRPRTCPKIALARNPQR